MLILVEFLAWGIFVLGMAIAFQWATRWLSKFSILTIALGALFLRFGPAVPLFDQVNPQRTGVNIRSDQLIRYYLALILTYIGILVGVWAVRYLNVPWTTAPRKAIAPSTSLLLAMTGLIMGTVVLVWVILPWPRFVSGLFVLLSVSHTAADYTNQRVGYGSDGLPSLVTYVGTWVRFALAPAMLWILYFLRRRNIWWRLLFWSQFLVLIAIGFVSGGKAYVVIPIIAYLVAHTLETGKPFVPLKTALGLAAGLLILVVALYHVQLPFADLSRIVELSIYRLTGEYNRTAQLRFIYYPDVFPFMNGGTSPFLTKVAGLFGMNVRNVVPPETLLPTLLSGEGPVYNGTWNAAFFADAWADFGYVGVVLEALLAGLILGSIARWYDTSGQGPVEKGVYVALCTAGIWLTDVGLLTALWTYGLLSSFLVYAAFRALARAPGKPATESLNSIAVRSP